MSALRFLPIHPSRVTAPRRRARTMGAMSPATTSLVVLAATVVLFVWNRLPVGGVAVLTCLTLYATGLVDADTALSGFGDPVVVFIASLFVVSEAIDSAGVTTWAGQRLIDVVGDGAVRLMVAVLGLCAVLTAVITLNGSVAALLPMVLVLATRIRRSPSLMLMPMAFAGSAGSLLALTGSPVNVIVSNAAVEAGSQPFGFFDFAVVGLPLVIGTVTPRRPARATGAPPTDPRRSRCVTSADTRTGSPPTTSCTTASTACACDPARPSSGCRPPGSTSRHTPG